MNKVLVMLLVLFFVLCPLFGCYAPGLGGNYATEQVQADVFMFAKIATRISLAEANVSQDDLRLIKNYLLTLRSFFSESDGIDFGAARELVTTELPPQCHIYGYTIIDVLERYVMASSMNQRQERPAVVAIINAGLSGAIEAVEEFVED